MTKKLQKMIDRFDKKIEEARMARDEIMYYLGKKYRFDPDKCYECFCSDSNWVEGIDMDTIEELVNRDSDLLEFLREESNK